MKFSSFCLSLLVAGLSSGAEAAYECDTSSGTSPIIGPASIQEDIVVPEGGVCTIIGEVSTMGIRVGEEAILEVGSLGGMRGTDGTVCPRIMGDVTCLDCDSVEITGSMSNCNVMVSGNINVSQANKYVLVRNVSVGDGIMIVDSMLPIELTVENNMIGNGKEVVIEKCTADKVKVTGNSGTVVLEDNNFEGDPEFDMQL